MVSPSTSFFDPPTHYSLMKSIILATSINKSSLPLNVHYKQNNHTKAIIWRSTHNRKPFVLLEQYVAHLEEKLAYQDVQHDSHWKSAMDKEMDNIHKMKT
jgi:hypothetical protein